MISAREVSAAENKVGKTLKVLQHYNIKSITSGYNAKSITSESENVGLLVRCTRFKNIRRQ